MFAKRIVAAVAIVGLLAGCGSSSDPLGDPDSTEAITVGSQQYYSNEIIAELYAQALEDAGYTVDRQYQIGQREVYLPELVDGSIDLLPEYAGNLLQFYSTDTFARALDEIVPELDDALPEGLRTLEAAEASDQDSYTVTRETADEYGLTTIGDLAKLEQPVVIGSNSEFETRPYGIPGLEEIYHVEGTLTPIEDSGSALTVKALLDRDVTVANIYTASPAIIENDLVVLQDPEAMILSQNVIPLVSDAVDDEMADVINEVTRNLSASDLQALNARSVNEQLTSAEIANDWLTEKGLK